MKKILLAAALGLVSLSCYSAGLYGPKECAKVTAAPAAAVKDGSIKEDQHRLAQTEATAPSAGSASTR